VSGDGNGTDDVFVRNLTTGTTTAVSAKANGTGTANGWSQGAVYSPNGAKVVFTSVANDLGPIDPGTTADLYVRDLATGVATLVSVNASGTGGANGGVYFPAFSPDGTKVTFTSAASNLGPNDTNGQEDIYVRNLVAGSTVLVSVSSAGTNAGNRSSTGSSFSPDGTKVLFTSRASDLGPFDSDSVEGCEYPACRDVYERNLSTGQTALVSANAEGTDSGDDDSLGGAYSSDGSLVLFSSLASDLGPNDTNDRWDIYVASTSVDD
jgi:Tol biopolymer transport system component